MIPLLKDMVLKRRFSPFVNYTLSPIQSGLGGDPWKVIVSSQLLQRTRRNVSILQDVFDMWPTPDHMSVSDVQLEEVLRPLGLHRSRARQLQRMSLRFAEGAFQDVRELPGCGPYVCDAVGLFCFGCVDLESSDHVLREYADKYVGPGIEYVRGLDLWRFVDRGHVIDSSLDPLAILSMYEEAIRESAHRDLLHRTD